MTSFTQRFLSVALVAAVASTALASRPGMAPVEPAAAAEPIRAISLGLAGYSPVSYLDERQAQPGNPAISAEHQGVTYFFTSDAQRQKFAANADKYLPAYGGTCAFGCSVNSTFVPDPTSFDVVDGRTVLFLKNDKVDAKSLWAKDPAAAKAKADAFYSSKLAKKSRAYIGARNLGADGVALAGYSPVSYIDDNKAQPGNPDFAVEHKNVTYFLTSAEQVTAFKANPDKYEPQCGGWCAYGMAVKDKFPIDPQKFKVIDGKLYIFLHNSGVDALALWNKGSDSEQIAKANAHWKKVSQ